MAGNKHDNGVHEIGTPETLKAYQEDTPGQEVEKYLAGIQEVIQEKKTKQKKSFMQVFQNPLKGFPYNEELDDNFVKALEEAKRDAKFVELEFRNKNEAIKAYKHINNKLYPGGTQPFDDIAQEGKWLQFDNVKDVKDVLNVFKKGGLNFKINKGELKLGESLEEAKNLMPAIHKIVDTKGAAKVGGVMLDMFTASVITQAYAKVNDSNKKKMENSNIQTLVKLAQRLMGMKEELGLDEGRLSDLLIDIQQGATAKELARDWKIPLSVAKDFLADYYADNRSRRPKREEVEIEESIRDVEKEFPRDREWKKIVNKHKNAIKKFWKGGRLDGKAEEDIVGWAMSNGEIRTDDVDETDEWLHDIILANEEVVSEGTNGMEGKKISVRYSPQRAKRAKPFSGKLTSHSTIDKSDLFKDVEKNTWELRDDCNSIAIRVPHGRGSEKDKEKWRELVNSSFDGGGSPAGLIRGGGLAPSEVKELFADMKKAANAFKGKVLAQAHEISIENRKGKLDVKKGLSAMLQAIDEFGMRNHVSVSGRDGVLTQIQYAANHLNEEVKPLQEQQTYKSLVQGLEKDKKEISKKSKAFGQNDTKFVDKAIDFLKMLEKEGIPAGQISQVDFVTNRVPKFFVGNPQRSPSFSKFTPNDVKKAVKHAKKMGIMESVDLKEGTWQIPDSYGQLLDLQKFLSKPHKAKTAREVHKFHIDADSYFGDDSFSDMLDAYYHTLPGGDIDPYDRKEKVSQKSLDRAKKYNKIKPGTDLNILLMKALTDWTNGDLQFDRRGKITQSPRDWYEKNNPKMRNKSRVVKDVIEGKMDGQKLTGQEISVYFRRNKVRDKMTRKAVEIALDHGGAMNYAIKQIEKLKRGLSKNKDVQKALNYANFGEQVRIKDVGFMFKEDSPVAGNIQVEGDPYIPFKTGSGKLNKNIEKYWKKEIRGISKDELLKIQTMYMITDHPGVVSMYKAGKRDFLKSLKD